jgi:hypothetical protein
MDKKLGKITKVSYGLGGYQDVQMGISFSLEADGWGVSDFWGFWADDPSDGAKWTKGEQITYWGNTTERIVKLLYAAKVKHVDQLKGIPVEVVFERNVLQSWRILEEVL